jgi:hypothetical protein
MKTFLTSLAALVAALATAPAGHAATLTVDRSDDVVASACSDTVLNDCSLRGAIDYANTHPGADTIIVPAGTYTLTRAAGPAAGGFDSNAALLITEDVTIIGAGASTTIIQACIVDQKTAPCPPGQGIARRAFAVTGVSMNVNISDVTIRHGRADGTGVTVSGGNGGAIYNDVEPTLTLQNVVVTDNFAETEGGGLFNRGPETLILIDSTVTRNLSLDGGGIANIHGGTARLLRSTVSGNTATGEGGGIRNRTGGVMTVTNSTVSGNVSAGDGGGIMTAGTLGLVNTTVTANTAGGGGQGGGGLAIVGSAEIATSIVANNTDTSGAAADCSGSLTSLGNVLIRDLTGCSLTGGGTTTISGIDPRLGPLADNGGPTKTHALLAGSPAIDAGDNALCPPEDQRGAARPTDGNGTGIAVCDLGAFEADGVAGGGVTVPLERVRKANFNLTRGVTHGLRPNEQYTETEAHFTLPAGHTIDPFTTPFRLVIAEPTCGGILSRFLLPAGSFRPLRRGVVAEAHERTTDDVTGAVLKVTVHLERESADEYSVVIRISNADYYCLRGRDERTVTVSMTIGDVTAESTAPFRRAGNGDLSAP